MRHGEHSFGSWAVIAYLNNNASKLSEKAGCRRDERRGRFIGRRRTASGARIRGYRRDDEDVRLRRRRGQYVQRDELLRARRVQRRQEGGGEARDSPLDRKSVV